jgi:6-phosphogluconolactonase (cycloisomerase 2 family)
MVDCARTARTRLPVRAIVRGLMAAASLMLPAHTAFAQLDDNCTVSVLNRNAQARPDGTWVISNIPIGQGLVRARAICTFNGITRFGQSDLFTVPLSGSITLQPIVFGAITPIPSVLVLTASTTTLTSAGATTQLAVTAQYSNAPSADVTSSQAGTTYTSSNPEIATVSADGFVTAVASGNAILSAFNEGTVGTLSIHVGIMPTISITSPAAGTTVTEGATIPVVTTTTGNVAVVTLLVNSQVAYTSVAAPFTFTFAAPPNVSSVTLGAKADDGFGNIGTARPVPINVARDPRTTVTGTVTDAAASPVAGATVTCLSGSTSTINDGTFLLAREPTARGPIACVATATISGVSVSGVSASVAPVAAGTTNVGRIVLQARGTLAVVALAGANSAAVIDTVRNSVLATLPAGAVPLGAAVTPDGRVGIVTNFGGGSLTFIDLTANPPATSGTLATTPQLTNPAAIAVTPNGRFGVVLNGGATATTVNNVVSVDIQQQRIVSTLPMNSLTLTSGVAITPDGAFALVVDEVQNQVLVLAVGADGTLTDTGQSVSLTGSAGLATTIAITPDGRRALVVNSFANSVNILGITGGVVTNIGVVTNLGSSSSGIAVTPDGTKAYVSDSFGSTGATVAVLQIDANDNVTDTGRRIAIANDSLPVAGFGIAGIAVTADGTRLWISGFGSGQISIVDTATDTLLPQTIAAPGSPFGIGMPARR